VCRRPQTAKEYSKSVVVWTRIRAVGLREAKGVRALVVLASFDSQLLPVSRSGHVVS
jgi:hypothetical protein